MKIMLKYVPEHTYYYPIFSNAENGYIKTAETVLFIVRDGKLVLAPRHPRTNKSRKLTLISKIDSF